MVTELFNFLKNKKKGRFRGIFPWIIEKAEVSNYDIRGIYFLQSKLCTVVYSLAYTVDYERATVY